MQYGQNSKSILYLTKGLKRSCRCGPCKVISPYFDTLAKGNKDVNFLKCDVDQVPDVAQRYSVRSM